MKGTSALWVVILTLSFGVALTLACGGPDKPPLTPDGPDMQMTDGGPTAMPSAAPVK